MITLWLVDIKYIIVIIYEIHQIHITYYWVSTYINDVVVSTWKYTVCSQHVLDYMTMVHVTGVSTWGFYMKCMICKLRLVHKNYLYNCMSWDWYNNILIVIVNMEYHIIVLMARDSVFQISIVSAEFGSSRFCWVNFSLCFFAWVCSMVRWRICSSLTVWSQLLYESLTGTWTGNLDLQLGPTYL